VVEERKMSENTIQELPGWRREAIERIVGDYLAERAYTPVNPNAEHGRSQDMPPPESSAQHQSNADDLRGMLEDYSAFLLVRTIPILREGREPRKLEYRGI